MENKTKILAVGDIHGDTGLVKRLAKRARDEKVDLVIIAGDLTLAESSLTNLIGPFIKENKQVLLIPGNHESEETINFLAEKYPNTKSIHGYSIRKGNLGIFGSGTIDWGADGAESKKIFRELDKANKYLGETKKKIMVTHMHPRDSNSEFTGFVGSSAVKKAIKQFHPDIAICAHIHEAGGLIEEIGKTTVIHVARTAAIFEI
jgi:hypothetical protein